MFFPLHIWWFVRCHQDISLQTFYQTCGKCQGGAKIQIAIGIIDAYGYYEQKEWRYESGHDTQLLEDHHSIKIIISLVVDIIKSLFIDPNRSTKLQHCR